LVNLGIEPDRFAALMRSQGLPEAWMLALVDGNGRIIAQSRQQDRFVGGRGDKGPPGTGDGFGGDLDRHHRGGDAYALRLRPLTFV